MPSDRGVNMQISELQHIGVLADDLISRRWQQERTLAERTNQDFPGSALNPTENPYDEESRTI